MESKRGASTFLGEVLLYARVAKKHDWHEYERLKKMVVDCNLSLDEYYKAINMVAEILEL